MRNVRKAVRLRSMDNHSWSQATWPEIAALGLRGAESKTPSREGVSPVVALLPIGAVEAHGPHLPLTTDVTIAGAAADAATPGLETLGYRTWVLPPIAYTTASFAAGFPGTISVRPSTVSALIRDVAVSLGAQGVTALVLVNAHLDPQHIASLREATIQSREALVVVFPDISRKPWALRMTDEFKSGACHAGQYETSVVMAAAPDTVREDARRGLPENPASLSEAIGRGVTTFEEAGASEAYCGAPAAATAEEGLHTIQTLGQIVIDAVCEELG